MKPRFQRKNNKEKRETEKSPESCPSHSRSIRCRRLLGSAEIVRVDVTYLNDQRFKCALDGSRPDFQILGVPFHQNGRPHRADVDVLHDAHACNPLPANWSTLAALAHPNRIQKLQRTSYRAETEKEKQIYNRDNKKREEVREGVKPKSHYIDTPEELTEENR